MSERERWRELRGGGSVNGKRTLALLEMKTVLAKIYQNFDVERVGAATKSATSYPSR